MLVSRRLDRCTSTTRPRPSILGQRAADAGTVLNDLLRRRLSPSSRVIAVAHPRRGAGSVDCFEKPEQIGEGTYGYASIDPAIWIPQSRETPPRGSNSAPLLL